MSLAVFLALMLATNLAVAWIPAHYDARFRVLRATVRGYEQIIAEAKAERKQGRAVVFVLGDSVGWGYASPRPYQTVAYGIMRGLDRLPQNRLPPNLRNREAKVYNLCAMSAYAPDQYALMMRFLGAADLIVLQLYPGHYSEAYLKAMNFPAFSELADGLDPADPLSRELMEAVPKESYPQRLLGWTAKPAAWAASLALPLAAKKNYLISRSGLDLTDPNHLLKSRTGSSLFVAYPDLSPAKRDQVLSGFKPQLAFTDGPHVARALRYYEGMFIQAQKAGIPMVVAATPWNPALRDRVEANPRYRARLAQLRRMAEEHCAAWLDYTRMGPLPLTARDFHDLCHMVGDAPITVGERIAADMDEALSARKRASSSSAGPRLAPRSARP